MLDSTDIQKLARKHGVSGDPAAIVALVRAVEHLTVGAIVTRAAISFANPQAITSDASQAVDQLAQSELITLANIYKNSIICIM